MGIKRLAFLALFAAILSASSFSVFSIERIVDNAGLLSASQKNNLEKLAESIARAYRFDLVIVTERSIGNASPMNYADDFFDYNGYSFNGCLFLQVTGTRDYWISTSGSGIKILNDYAFSKLENDIMNDLRAGNYYQAYLAFIQDWELFLSLNAQGGRSYNFLYQWNYVVVAIAWVVAFIIGLVIVHAWKTSMNNVHQQRAAASYIVSGSLIFKVKKDSFLYSTVTRTQRQTQSGSSGGRGIHTGSSGRSHGGRGGRY